MDSPSAYAASSEVFPSEAGAQPPCALSVVVPVFDEEAVLPEFHRRLASALVRVPGGCEVIYVDDGSTDRTPQLLRELHIVDPSVGVARFSRNFGKESAMSAGLRLARGAAVIVIDADLQHPPEAIPSMVDAWREGADLVNMRKRNRAGENWLRRYESSPGTFCEGSLKRPSGTSPVNIS